MMAGVANNLRASLEEKCDSFGYTRVNVREDAPLSEAIRLMVRERLTGEKLPEGGEQLGEPVARLGQRQGQHGF